MSTPRAIWLLLLGVTAALWLLGIVQLRRAHARRRTFALDTARYVVAGAAWLVAPPFARDNVVAAAIFGFGWTFLVAIPREWVIGLGGLEPKWEIRRLRTEAILMARGRMARGEPVGVAAMNKYVARIESQRRAETAEFCWLVTTSLEDCATELVIPRVIGVRAVRTYDVMVSLYGQENCGPVPDQIEATFLYGLHVVFADMIEIQTKNPTPELVARLNNLISKLDAYRRPDTIAFIEAMRRYASKWMGSDATEQVRRPLDNALADRSSDFYHLHHQLFPTDGVFWGATLDEVDETALAWLLTDKPWDDEATATPA